MNCTVDVAIKAEREMRLWVQNGILNSEPWGHFIKGPNGECRFDEQTLTIYERVRKQLAEAIYKGGPAHGSHSKKDVLRSSVKQDWLTPPWFLDIVRKLGPISFDPCANPRSFVHAWQNIYYPFADGLSIRWYVPEDTVCFVNPPYGRTIKFWANKMATEGSTIIQRANAHLVGLIPARTGTGYWEKYIWPFADAVCFWNGGTEYPSRISFYDLDGRPAKIGATFDAAVVYFGTQREKFQRVFEPYGRIQLLN